MRRDLGLCSTEKNEHISKCESGQKVHRNFYNTFIRVSMESTSPTLPMIARKVILKFIPGRSFFRSFNFVDIPVTDVAGG